MKKSIIDYWKEYETRDNLVYGAMAGLTVALLFEVFRGTLPVNVLVAYGLGILSMGMIHWSLLSAVEKTVKGSR